MCMREHITDALCILIVLHGLWRKYVYIYTHITCTGREGVPTVRYSNSQKTVPLQLYSTVADSAKRSKA